MDGWMDGWMDEGRKEGRKEGRNKRPTHPPTSPSIQDKHGKSGCAKRNLDSYRTLRHLSLTYDNEEWDAHLQSDVSVLLGDLNYRLTATPQVCRKLISPTQPPTHPRYPPKKDGRGEENLILPHPNHLFLHPITYFPFNRPPTHPTGHLTNSHRECQSRVGCLEERDGRKLGVGRGWVAS